MSLAACGSDNASACCENTQTRCHLLPERLTSTSTQQQQQEQQQQHQKPHQQQQQQQQQQHLPSVIVTRLGSSATSCGQLQLSVETTAAAAAAQAATPDRQLQLRWRWLLLLVVIVLVLVIALLAVHMVISVSDEKTVCLSSDCVATAASLLAAMDPTVDPCDDFFRYACGRYNREHVIPDDRGSISTFELLSDKLQVTLKDLLEQSIDAVNDSEATIKAKTFYSSCMNLVQIERAGDSALREAITSLGGWPVLNPSWQAAAGSLETLLGRVRGQYNVDAIFQQWIGADDRNSSQNIIQIDQMRLSLPSRDYFTNSRYGRELDAYRQLVVAVARLLGARGPHVAEQVAQLLQLEIQLSNASVSEADRHDTGAIYSKLDLYQLERLTPAFRWGEYLRSFLHTPISDHEPVVVYSMPYLRAADAILHNTDTRTVHNFVVWRLIKSFLPHLTPPYQQLFSNFRKVLLGIPSERSRWNLCVEWTNNHFGMAVGALFIKDNFDEESKRTALEMINRLRQAFVELLEHNEWMDDDTRRVARDKALAMHQHIGYPDFISSPQQLDKQFDNIAVTGDRFLDNILAVCRFRAQTNIGLLREPVSKRQWRREPQVVVVNAFYNPNKNDIVFPAGILQPSFYSRHFPKSLNYGGIGVVIGHEITHGFDDKGRQFDRDGNMQQWWNNATIASFRRHTQCMVQQYSGYRLAALSSLAVNGRMTRGENIADNGGLKQAYRAYRGWVEQHGAEPLLPGLALTHDQLFFLNYAQIWCGSMRPEDAETKLMSSVHAPGPIRVIGPLSNSHEFARAYSCASGTRMNPVQKCTVW